jgi:hypothetical protein
MISILIIYFSIASQYSQGTMKRVLLARQECTNVWVCLPENAPVTDGLIAVKECDALGEIWYIKSPKGNWESFYVVDCAMPSNTDGAIEWMETYGIDLEIDYETAKRWGTIGRGLHVQYTKMNPYLEYGLMP